MKYWKPFLSFAFMLKTDGIILSRKAVTVKILVVDEVHRSSILKVLTKQWSELLNKNS